MVKPREEQLGPITILDEDSGGTVNASSARIINLLDPVGDQDAATRAWVLSQVGGGGGGGGGGEDLFATLDLGNTTDGYDIRITGGSEIRLNTSSSIILRADSSPDVNGMNITPGHNIIIGQDTGFGNLELRASNFVQLFASGTFTAQFTTNNIQFILPLRITDGNHIEIGDQFASPFSQSGLIRLPQDREGIKFRNSDNNDDISAIDIINNNLILGDTNLTNLITKIDTDGYYNFDINNSTILSVESDVVNINTDGYISQNLTIGGKLTVGGLIDPTGMVFDIQASVPGGTPSTGKATLWIRDSDGYAIVTDDSGQDTVLNGSGSGGGGENLTETLAIGNATGGNNLVITNGDSIVSDGSGTVLIDDGLHVSDFVSSGLNVAQSGRIRLPVASSGNTISFRNAGNSADLSGIQATGSNILQLGSQTGWAGINLSTATGNISSLIGGTTELSVSAGLVNAQDNEIRTSGFVSIGGTLATQGDLRTDGSFTFYGVNEISNDVRLLQWVAGSVLTIGEDSNSLTVEYRADDIHRTIIDGVIYLEVRTNGPVALSGNNEFFLRPQNIKNSTTINAAATDTTDIAVSTNHRIRIHAICDVEDGSGDFYRKDLYIEAENRGGTVNIILNELVREFGNALCTYEAAVSTTNVRFTTTNNEATSVTRTEFIHYLEYDLP